MVGMWVVVDSKCWSVIEFGFLWFKLVWFVVVSLFFRNDLVLRGVYKLKDVSDVDCGFCVCLGLW